MACRVTNVFPASCLLRLVRLFKLFQVPLFRVYSLVNFLKDKRLWTFFLYQVIKRKHEFIVCKIKPNIYIYNKTSQPNSFRYQMSKHLASKLIPISQTKTFYQVILPMKDFSYSIFILKYQHLILSLIFTLCKLLSFSSILLTGLAVLYQHNRREVGLGF